MATKYRPCNFPGLLSLVLSPFHPPSLFLVFCFAVGSIGPRTSLVPSFLALPSFVSHWVGDPWHVYPINGALVEAARRAVLK